MNKILKSLHYSHICLVLSLMSLSSYAGAFAVIANESVKADTISSASLKQIYLANKVKWDDGKSLVLITFNSGTDEGDSISKELMGMTSAQSKKHFLTKVFNGVLASPPPSGESPDDIVELVAKTPGSIAVVPAGTKTAKTKVLKLTE